MFRKDRVRFMEQQVIIYNDNSELSGKIAPFLQGENIKMTVVHKEEELLQILSKKNAQLLLFDVELNGLDWYNGVEVLSRIRKMSDISIMVVSAQAMESAKIMALNAGADDYVTFDCNPLELVARVKCHMRRYEQLIQMRIQKEQVYRVDGLEIDDVAKRVCVDGREVKLTPSEYEILKLLVQKRGRVMSVNQIYESVWHMQAFAADNTIAVHIRHIREKIEHNPKDPQYVKVVWGNGYKVG